MHNDGTLSDRDRIEADLMRRVLTYSRDVPLSDDDWDRLCDRELRIRQDRNMRKSRKHTDLRLR